MYQYKAKFLRVVDGDTVDLEVDLGFKTFQHQRFRLAGINAFELKHPKGAEAAARLVSYIMKFPSEFVIRTEKDKQEKFGRYLVTISDPDNPNDTTKSINQRLIDDGLAVKYSKT